VLAFGGDQLLEQGNGLVSVAGSDQRMRQRRRDELLP
jgi:hypothetical protein